MSDRIWTRSRERLEDIQWMAETGESFKGAAKRLGICEKTLERWCEKHAPDVMRRLRARDPRDVNYRTGTNQYRGFVA